MYKDIRKTYLSTMSFCNFMSLTLTQIFKHISLNLKLKMTHLKRFHTQKLQSNIQNQTHVTQKNFMAIASVNVVSIVAKYDVPSGEWPELFPSLLHSSGSIQEDQCEVALILFSALTEIIKNAFRLHFADLQALLLKCLQEETSNRVRVVALKAVGSFMEFTHNGGEVIKFREFIPRILHVSRQCLASGEEDVAIVAFEIFDELIESPRPLMEIQLHPQYSSCLRFTQLKVWSMFYALCLLNPPMKAKMMTLHLNELLQNLMIQWL